MSVQRYVAERRDEGTFVQKVETPILQKEDGVMAVSIAGAGDPDDLAREAAESHFARHPERKKVFILVSSRSDRRWENP
jgi:hypothetical protein